MSTEATTMPTQWEAYQQQRCLCPSVGLTLDLSRMTTDDEFVAKVRGLIGDAYDQMDAIERGEQINTTEDRAVGHYWLRNTDVLPDSLADLRDEINNNRAAIKSFADDVRASGEFDHVLMIGIGGSALGPQFISEALGKADDPVTFHYLDNTDPDGFARTLRRGKGVRDRTLVVVISKSGTTPETWNGMQEALMLWPDKASFLRQAVAITGLGINDKGEPESRYIREFAPIEATDDRPAWRAVFPLWDWVGGRTSITAAVGLVPMALQGLDIDAFLEGAAEMDELTRRRDDLSDGVPNDQRNPAARLAAAWYGATEGKGRKAMVVLPYKDRLALFAKYLQQLVMESLGKAESRDGADVHQGLTVYGNKGSTDQHAYVQQLRDGKNDFFATFVTVKCDYAEPPAHEVGTVDDGHTSGDFLRGFYLGTRDALSGAGRQSLTIELEELNARTIGALIALYERAVGYYASFVNVNAYDQPGVEAGKKAAKGVLNLKSSALDVLRASGEAMTLDQIADRLLSLEPRPQGLPDEPHETLYHVLEYLAANGRGLTIDGDGYRAVGD